MNTSSLDELIDQFTNYFRAKTDEIAALESRHFRCALYLTLLDSLGRARDPKWNSHDRIVRFVQEHSGWPYVHRVSLSQLHMSLSAKAINQGALFGEVTRRLPPLQDDLVYRAQSEPAKTDLEQFATTDAEKRLIAQSTYSELLYPLRNILLHEFRIPGYGINFRDSADEPYSHSYVDQPRQTVFPPGFLHKLCTGCISGLSAYLKTHKIDPYGNYEFGSLWRPH